MKNYYWSFRKPINMNKSASQGSSIDALRFLGILGSIKDLASPTITIATFAFRLYTILIIINITKKRQLRENSMIKIRSL